MLENPFLPFCARALVDVTFVYGSVQPHPWLLVSLLFVCLLLLFFVSRVLNKLQPFSSKRKLFSEEGVRCSAPHCYIIYHVAISSSSANSNTQFVPYEKCLWSKIIILKVFKASLIFFAKNREKKSYTQKFRLQYLNIQCVIPNFYYTHAWNAMTQTKFQTS